MFKKTFKENPAMLLLLMVYLWFVPACLSYQNSWVHPEELFIKSFLLKTGPQLSPKDIPNGLFWQLFEYKPRSTRPLASYFEILDTKFRCWLWHFIPPHPSLSLTWIFSLILGPFFLYRLLKNLGADATLATALTAFYVATPGTMSCVSMLFRPAKPMANFFMIFCLYLASVLKKDHLDKNHPIPTKDFLIFWAITAVSFYWDESALLIFPAMFLVFPSILRRKLFLFFWWLLPAITLTAYLAIIPYLSTLAGHQWPHLMKYDLIHSFYQPETISNAVRHFVPNSCNLALETMGLLPCSGTAPAHVKIFMFLAVMAWGVLIYKAGIPRRDTRRLAAFLVFLLFWFNAMLSVISIVWGPYYYGSYWPVFFVAFLARYLGQAKLPPLLIAVSFFFIAISAANAFMAINLVNKKYHWYPYNPGIVEEYYQGQKPFFDNRDQPDFSDHQLQAKIRRYWLQVKDRTAPASFSLPRELGWLPTELEPEKSFDRAPHFYTYDFTAKKDTITAYGKAIEKTDPRMADDYKVYSMDIEADPKLSEAYNDRANIYFQTGDLAQAVADYKKAVAIRPDYADAYFNLGMAYYKAGQAALAADSYSKAVAINPRDSNAYYDRAICFYQLKDYAKAWGDIGRLKELGAAVDPKLVQALDRATGRSP